jgi:RNA polymerase sigma-70 factor (ECF subfamily)
MSTSPGVRDTDLKLIKLAAAGNTEAFSTLFEQYFDSVYNFALWLCNDPHLAEDLVQETFIRAHKNLHRLGPPFNVRSWLYRMARNLFVDMRRRNPEMQSLDPSLEPGDESDPEVQMLTSELSGPVRRALQRLSPNHREALILREVEHMQYEDIAAVMGVSLDNVKVLLHRARNSFRDEYGVRLLMEEPLPDCRVLNELLDAMADGQSVGKQEAMVRDHIKDCPTCQQRKRMIAALALLLGHQPRLGPPPDVKRRIGERASRVRPPGDPATRRRRLASIGGGAAMLILLIWMWRFLGLPDPTSASFPDLFSGPPGEDGRGGGGDSSVATPTRDPAGAAAREDDTTTPTVTATVGSALLIVSPEVSPETTQALVVPTDAPTEPPTDTPAPVPTDTPTPEPKVCSKGWVPVNECVCCGANKICPDHVEVSHPDCTQPQQPQQPQAVCGDNICDVSEQACGVCSIDCGPC